MFGIRFLLTVSALLNSFAYCGGGVLDFGKAVLDIVKTINEQYKVIVYNNCSASIYLKCASADDTILGDGADENGFWTLQNGQALGWGFKENFSRTTCFWCYANHNGEEARNSGNWYIHQDVWGWTGCGGPGNNSGKDGDGVTSWEMRDDGAYTNMCGGECQDGNVFQRSATWGPAPN